MVEMQILQLGQQTRVGLYWRFIVLQVGGNRLTDNQGMLITLNACNSGIKKIKLILKTTEI